MIRIGKTLLVIGCLSLASAACASDETATHAERMRKLLESRATFLDSVVAAIKRDTSTYGVTRMPDNSGTLYTARTEFPGGILRTISALQKSSGRIERATIFDVTRAPQAKDDKTSFMQFEGAQAQSVFDALKAYGIKE
ncbi:MAG: hypothetical protein IT346_01480 [Epsilonproteobacteria bacterium]|nr:hypothetical protein [Campylobacterota bacterium]